MDFDPLELIGGALGRSAFELLRQRLCKTVVVPNPVAGADWSTRPPAGTVWELLSVSAQLATSAVVANRTPRLVIDDSGNRIFNEPVVAAIAASKLYPLTWFPNCGNPRDAGNGTGQQLELLASPIPESASIAVITAALDVGDQWGPIVVRVREWSASAMQSNLDWLIKELRR